MKLKVNEMYEFNLRSYSDGVISLCKSMSTNTIISVEEKPAGKPFDLLSSFLTTEHYSSPLRGELNTPQRFDTKTKETVILKLCTIH